MIHNITAYDQRIIEVHQWLPKNTPLKVLVLSHGMGEHIERYAHFAKVCNDNGIAVLGANHRGHGPSAQRLGYFADSKGWDLVLSDLSQVIEFVTEKFATQPVLLGHSMGSFVARHYASKYGNTIAGLVLCGSNHLGTLLFRFGLFAAKLEKLRIGKATPSRLLDKLSFGDFNKKIVPLRTSQDWLSRDPKIVDQFIADPYCGFICTPQFWIDFLGGLNEMSKTHAFEAIPNDLPIYLISGAADPVSRYGKGLKALEEKLISSGKTDITSHLYPEARHELLNEINREEVYRDLFAWLGN
ncbi:lysophospholipase [Psychromonas sp. PT13]|uniref:alpha/beta hydrolase n=1 Tax=Psychromonas sp. PT13 TaxID=3439547 RepID=UPI003EBFBAC8